MATPRKKYKIRDREATMKALLEAVGDILREVGFSGLRTTAITRHAGKDKNMIRYHFGGLGALLAEYVRDKDYWPPFFERFRPEEPVSAREMEAVFTELMEENFRHFLEDREMQRVILWQASDFHAVMRSASARREEQGRALIRATDRWFAGTDVDFGTVLAIVLGGTYFTVLQQAAGNGPVCGVELEVSRHREVFQRTIGQVIHWAWQAAAGDNKGTEMKELNYEYELLDNLAGMPRKTDGAGRPDLLVKGEARRLETLLLAELMRLDNETQVRLFLKAHFNRLVGLCNRFYDPHAAANPDAEAIIGVMDALRRAVSDMLPEEVALPDMFRDGQASGFLKRWEAVKAGLGSAGADARLVDIMAVPVVRFADRSRTATWMAFRYLRKYMAGLEAVVVERVADDWELCRRLVGLGFNHALFAAYLAHFVRERAAGEGEHRPDYLKAVRRGILQVHRLTMMRFDRDMPPMAEELIRWLDAEMSADGTKRPPNGMKFHTTFRATQLALWQKLLHDHRVYDEANLDLLAEKTAHGFTTKGQESLSPASIKSKFYTKDPADIRAIRGLLDRLRGDLDDFG